MNQDTISVENLFWKSRQSPMTVEQPKRFVAIKTAPKPEIVTMYTKSCFNVEAYLLRGVAFTRRSSPRTYTYKKMPNIITTIKTMPIIHTTIENKPFKPSMDTIVEETLEDTFEPCQFGSLGPILEGECESIVVPKQVAVNAPDTCGSFLLCIFHVAFIISFFHYQFA